MSDLSNPFSHRREADMFPRMVTRGRVLPVLDTLGTHLLSPTPDPTSHPESRTLWEDPPTALVGRHPTLSDTGPGATRSFPGVWCRTPTPNLYI